MTQLFLFLACCLLNFFPPRHFPIDVSLPKVCKKKKEEEGEKERKTNKK